MIPRMTKYRVVIFLCTAIMLLWCSIASAALWDVLSGDAIPKHPSMRKVSEDTMLMNGIKIDVVVYEGDLAMSTAIEFYENVLVAQGWKVKDAGFTKEGMYRLLGRRPKGGMCNLNFIPQPQRGVLRLQVLHSAEDMSRLQENLIHYGTFDANGINPTPLPEKSDHYPGLKRYSSLRYGDGRENVTYVLNETTCISCVVAFYKEQLAKKGWRFVAEQRQTRQESQHQIDDLVTLIERYETSASIERPPELQGKDLRFILGGNFPDESVSLRFRKGNDACSILVMLRRAQTSQAYFEEALTQLGVSAAEKKKIQEGLSYAADMNNYLADIAFPVKDRIEISIAYFPGMVRGIKQ